MKKKKILKIILILSLIIITWFVYSEYFKKDKSLLSKPVNPTKDIEQEAIYNSNIIKDVSYTSKDNDGNEYIINATKGEIDYSDASIIYLTDVKALIKLNKNNSNNIIITSNYGKYIVLRHAIEGLQAYSLYAHLSKIREGLKVDQSVTGGDTLGVLGRTTNTRDAISKDRAHLHFEIGLQINTQFDSWFNHWYRGGKNHHGAWNGINLLGLDAADILQQDTAGSFNFTSHISKQPLLCRVRIHQAQLEWAERFPGLVVQTVNNETLSSDGKYGFDITPTLLGFLKKRVPDMNVVGFFVAGSGRRGTVKPDTLRYAVDGWNYENRDSNKIQNALKELKKNNVFVAKSKGYDEYYILPGSMKTEEYEMSDELVGASKAKLKTAFGKSTAGRVSSRPLLNKFISMVA